MPLRSSLIGFSLLVLPALPILPLAAQVPSRSPVVPRELPPSISPVPIPAPPPSVDELLPSPPPDSSAPPATTPCVPATIFVKGFRFEGRITAFSQTALRAVVQDLENKDLTCAQLVEAANRIEQLYIKAGYINSGAALPQDATIDNGIVPIAIVEGQLEPIRVCFVEPPPPGTTLKTGRPCERRAKRQRLSDRYIRDRVAIAAGTPLNMSRVLDALRLLKLNPLVQDIRAQLAPSSRQGYSLLTIEVVEANSLSAEVLLDNGRSPSVGSFRRQIQATQGNLTGRGDRLTLSYANTSGSNTGNLSYSLPVNPRGGTLGLNIGLAASNVIEPPFSILDIESSSSSYELAYRQPLVLKPEREVAVSFVLSHRVSNATLLDGLVPFPSIGAEADGRTRVTALRFVQDATWRNAKAVFGLRSQFSLGLNFLNATVNDFPPDSNFVSWLGQVQWARTTGLGLLVLKADLQVANRPLLPSEQFGLGGQGSVRGYRQDALLTDGGIFASAELRIPILQNYQSQFSVEAVPFVDFGHGWNRPSIYGQALEQDTLLSAGLGVRTELGDRFSARLEWGIPLIKLPDPIFGRRKSLQESGVYFSLSYRF